MGHVGTADLSRPGISQKCHAVRHLLRYCCGGIGFGTVWSPSPTKVGRSAVEVVGVADHSHPGISQKCHAVRHHFTTVRGWNRVWRTGPSATPLCGCSYATITMVRRWNRVLDSGWQQRIKLPFFCDVRNNILDLFPGKLYTIYKICSELSACCVHDSGQQMVNCGYTVSSSICCWANQFFRR